MMEFEWNKEKARINVIKHTVSFEEASTVFDDPFAVYYEDKFHSLAEERFIVKGYSNSDRLLIVSFLFKDKIIRIISARLATKKERKHHEK